MKQLARMIAALCLFVTLLVLRELPAGSMPSEPPTVTVISLSGS